MKRLVSALALLLLTASAMAAEPAAGYVMGYFTETPDHVGDSHDLHLAVSEDGLKWMPLNQNKPVFVPKTGEQGVRDPFFVRKADGSFVILFTNLQANVSPFPTILAFDSPDLITFTNERLLRLHNRQDLHASAPEAFWDPVTERYGIIWSGRTDYDRIYVNYTRDFVNVTPPAIFFDPGFGSTDATILAEPPGGEQFLYFTDGARHRIAGARSDSLAAHSFDDGIYTKPIGSTAVHAPLVYKANGRNEWYLWGDGDEAQNGEFFAWTSANIAKDDWQPLSKADYNQPLNSRHATVLPITRAEMDKLVEHWGRPEWNRIKSYSEPDCYVRHYAFKGSLAAYPFDPYFDSIWKVVPGLADAKGVSFESVNYPSNYLRRDGRDLFVVKSDDSAAFRASATFYKEPGLADPKWSSFRSFDAPKCYIRQSNKELHVEELTTPEAKKDATFQLVY